jgi:polyketide cyclase/dehydrase/lipid transport protein
VAHYRREIAVPTSLDTTFAYLSRFSSAEEWDPSVIEARMVTPEPVGLGSRFRLVAVFLGAKVPLEYEIIEYEPPRRVVLTAENRSVRSTDTISFDSEASGGTVVRYEAALLLKGAARLAGPLFAMALRRVGDRAADGLRSALFDHAAHPSSRPREGRR